MVSAGNSPLPSPRPVSPPRIPSPSYVHLPLPSPLPTPLLPPPPPLPPPLPPPSLGWLSPVQGPPDWLRCFRLMFSPPWILRLDRQRKEGGGGARGGGWGLGGGWGSDGKGGWGGGRGWGECVWSWESFDVWWVRPTVSGPHMPDGFRDMKGGNVNRSLF